VQRAPAPSQRGRQGASQEGIPGTRISNIPTSHRRNSGAIQRSTLTPPQTGAKTFTGQSQRKRLLNREAPLSKIGPAATTRRSPA